MQSTLESSEPQNDSYVAKLTSPVYEINPLSDLRWEDLVATHTSATVFHTIRWLKALRQTYGFQPIALTTSSPDEPLENGLVFCRVSSWLTGNRLISLPFSDHCQPLLRGSSDLARLLTSLRERVGHEGCKYIELRPLRPLGVAIESKCHLAGEDSFCMHLLDLRPSLDDLYKSFHKSCVQRKLQKSRREELRIETGTSREMLEHFYQLLIMTRRRHRLPPQPIEWFANLLLNLGDRLSIAVAFKDKTPIASILTLTHNKTVIYKYGCSNPDFHNLGGTLSLFWHAIQNAKTHGFEQFDFGRSELANTGLVSFKDHWGATRTPLRYYRHPSQPPPKTKGALKGFGERMARSILPSLPNSVLTTIGKLLYKHSA